MAYFASLLNNIFIMFSVLYTKKIRFVFTVIQKTFLNILAVFNSLMQSIY